MCRWKSIYAIGSFPQCINELNEEESAELLAKFKRMITENHDLQVRFKWRNANDLGPSYFCDNLLNGPADVCFQPSGTTAAHFTVPRSTTRVSGSALAIVL